ncbi:hypothetical protein P280DRAFT_508320 [Massarina eburnea CBS 473.64]|uniref:Uncharacterized protein n=1 Tax=Massarina eburnea CBS 473.64 TaxID=1395130 RepID=A0A6A6RVI3_9PLEO|nr:hypothetical protein P280DRAFT_508320 [Massarina eburnea CBS 473.64]
MTKRMLITDLHVERCESMNMILLVFAMFFSNDVWAVYGIITPRETTCIECDATQVRTLVTTTSGIPTNTVIPTASPVPTTQPTKQLRTGLKVGIGIAVGLLGVVLILIIFESCFLRHRRQQKALQRAVDEVERGADKENEERIVESQERMVLESRVSIVVEDEFDSEEEERGRHGLSLARRH